MEVGGREVQYHGIEMFSWMGCGSFVYGVEYRLEYVILNLILNI